MSALGQQVLIQHLSDTESLDALIREGLIPEAVPDERLRATYLFALDYYHQSGRTKAPSPAVFFAEPLYGTAIEDHGIDIEHEPEESVEWAIDDLKGSWTLAESARFNREFATAMAGSDTPGRVQVLHSAASDLVRMSMVMERADAKVDAREAMEDRVRAYYQRAATRNTHRGMHFGLAPIDAYTYGIHDGEVAVLAAPPKTGKSYFLAWVALQEWRAGRRTTIFTLENSVEMTLDRIACLACSVESRDWQRGMCDDDSVQRVVAWLLELAASDVPLWVLQPDIGHRTVEQMVREAQVRETQSLIIDQLSWIEMPDPKKNKTERIGDSMHTLKALVATARHPMSVLLAHQINREGVEAARKTGHLEMNHLAESAEMERTPDWVFGLYQSVDEQTRGWIKFQTLASRREINRHFQLTWTVGSGNVYVNQEITL